MPAAAALALARAAMSAHEVAEEPAADAPMSDSEEEVRAAVARSERWRARAVEYCGRFARVGCRRFAALTHPMRLLPASPHASSSARPPEQAASRRRRGRLPAASPTLISPGWTCVRALCRRALSRRVDAARLRSARASTQVQSLRKYRRVFKLGDPQTFGSKEELLPAVVRHWQNQARAARAERAARATRADAPP